jgi:hypothetical protein
MSVFGTVVASARACFAQTRKTARTTERDLNASYNGSGRASLRIRDFYNLWPIRPPVLLWHLFARVPFVRVGGLAIGVRRPNIGPLPLAGELLLFLLLLGQFFLSFFVLVESGISHLAPYSSHKT